MEKLKSGKIKIVSHQDRHTIPQGKTSHRFSFFKFSSAAPGSIPSAATKVSPKEPLLKGVHLSKTSGRLAAIEKWVDLEEKIVHAYQDRKNNPARPAPSLGMASSVSYATGMPGLKRASSGGSSFLRWSVILFVTGWAVAGLFAFFYARELPFKHDASLRIAGILDEKNRLEQSYSEIKTFSEEQRGSIQKLDGRIQRMTGELQTFREKAADHALLEKKYREELMRITTDYEIQLDSLRGALRSRDEIITSLRAQMQAIEKMIDQGSLAAFSGVASRVAQHGPVVWSGDEFLQGKVIAVSNRQGFFSVNIGAERGARSGREITIYRGNVPVGVGVVDRVYPTTSSVTMANPRALSEVREGDRVTF